jgi:DNA-binding MarR family transcriptional regulator
VSHAGSLMDMKGETDAAAIAIALTAAVRRLRGRLRQESPPDLAELTMPQAVALARIVEEGPISNAGLAAGEYVRPQSTHEMVLFLEGRGFVERRADPADGRKLLIEATPLGRRVVSALMGLRHQWLAAAIDRDLSAAEQEMLAIAAALIERIAASGERLAAPGDR